jgi:hypothetical protein
VTRPLRLDFEVDYTTSDAALGRSLTLAPMSRPSVGGWRSSPTSATRLASAEPGNETA